jgi:predicted unusual protein kinase regulating ubiquinone biosynthesis (AarF/ABC1/UbiB family)
MSRQTDSLKLMGRLAKAHFSHGNAGDFKRELFANFKQMGGVYVKFLQVLATNTDFLNGWATPSESTVFEDVALEKIDIFRVLKYIDRDYINHFAAVDREPMASGSFAQVYRAQLKNGQMVVIKVLRPSVTRYLQQDMKSLGRIARAVSFMSSRGAIDYAQAFREFRRVTELETDYQRETRNAEWFRDYFAGRTDQIVIPKTYVEFTADRVLVQDYVGGISLADAMRMQQNGANIAAYVQEKTGSNIWNQLEILGKELLISTVAGDYIFGDPHPGNIKLLPDDKIAFIDFGIAANVPTSRHAFVNFIREYNNLYLGQFRPAEFTIACLAFYDNLLTQAISVSTSNMTGSTVLDFIGNAANQIFETHRTDEQAQSLLNNLQMTRLATQVLNKGNRFNVKLDNNNLAMLRASQMYMSLVRLIVDRANMPLAISTAITQKAFQAMLDHVDVNGVAHSSASTETLSDEKALQLFGDWVASIADRDPTLYRQIKEGVI